MSSTARGSLTLEYAVLPASAPDIIKQNTIYIQNPKYIQPLVEEERHRSFQVLVRK